MDIAELLSQATTLLGLGMTFVFLFLGLLMVAVMLMAKYVPADEVATNKNGQIKKDAVSAADVSASSQVNPKLIAAITGAVQQYRKAAKA